MLQVIHDEDGQPHIVDTDSTLPVNSCINIGIISTALCLWFCADCVARNMFRQTNSTWMKLYGTHTWSRSILVVRKLHLHTAMFRDVQLREATLHRACKGLQMIWKIVENFQKL